jgi:hypothetical protein
MPRKTSTKKVRANQGGYLVATFENFPGVEIALLSDQESQVRGIVPKPFPPFETWTPQQQAAHGRLVEVMMGLAVRQTLRVVHRHLVGIGTEGPIPADFLCRAYRRALDELRADEWRPESMEFGFLRDVMERVLEGLLLEEPRPSRRRRETREP